MKKYFISYTHLDTSFVNEFILDLTSSEISATYDKWELKIGDSIINKLPSLIDASIEIIPIIPRNNISSNWVLKELSLAMTGEIDEGGRVLRVKIDNSTLPPALKIFAGQLENSLFLEQEILDVIINESNFNGTISKDVTSVALRP